MVRTIAVQNPLGLASRARGVQQEQGVLCIYPLRGAFCTLPSNSILPPDIPPRCDWGLLPALSFGMLPNQHSPDLPTALLACQ